MCLNGTMEEQYERMHELGGVYTATVESAAVPVGISAESVTTIH